MVYSTGRGGKRRQETTSGSIRGGGNKGNRGVKLPTPLLQRACKKYPSSTREKCEYCARDRIFRADLYFGPGLGGLRWVLGPAQGAQAEMENSKKPRSVTLDSWALPSDAALPTSI